MNTKQKIEKWNKELFPAKLEKRSGKNNYELVLDMDKVPNSIKLKRPRSKKQIDKLISDLEKSMDKNK